MATHRCSRLATGNLALLVAALAGLASCGRVRLEPVEEAPDASTPVDASGARDARAVPADARAPADAPAPCVWGAFDPPTRIYGIEGSDDWMGSVSEDGQTLVIDRFFSGTRNDLYIARRGALGEPFGDAVAIDELNSAAQDSTGVLVRGGLEIFFSSGRDTTPSSGLWRAARKTADGAFEAPSPVEELSGGDAHEHTLTPDGLMIYFTSSRPGSAGSDIWFAQRPAPDMPFSEPRRVAELADDGLDRAPGISADGLEIFFASDRAGGAGELDLWRATRPSADQPFGAPENVTELNTANDESFPHLSADGATLYFNYDTETQGGLDADVWEARRKCLQP